MARSGVVTMSQQTPKALQIPLESRYCQSSYPKCLLLSPVLDILGPPKPYQIWCFSPQLTPQWVVYLDPLGYLRPAPPVLGRRFRFQALEERRPRGEPISEACGLSGRHVSYEPWQPRQGEPRQPNKACKRLLGAVGPYWGLLGCLGSPCLGSNGLYEFGGVGPTVWGLCQLAYPEGPSNQV